MIEDAVLIQVDATVIVGALIFLTISPISKNPTGKELEQNMTLGSAYITIALLAVSIMTLVYSYGIDIAKTLTIVGIAILIIPVFAKIYAQHLTTSKIKKE